MCMLSITYSTCCEKVFARLCEVSLCRASFFTFFDYFETITFVVLHFSLFFDYFETQPPLNLIITFLSRPSQVGTTSTKPDVNFQLTIMRLLFFRLIMKALLYLR